MRSPRAHSEWELVGPAEVRDIDPSARYFTPWNVVPHTELMRLEQSAPELQPHLAKPPAVDEAEAFLTMLFLRRRCSAVMRRGR